jgi:hypothetical protein
VGDRGAAHNLSYPAIYKIYTVLAKSLTSPLRTLLKTTFDRYSRRIYQAIESAVVTLCRADIH